MGTILYPPLKQFILRIYFQDIEYPTISTLSQIYDKLSKDYPDPTRIRLISSKSPESELFYGPIRFLSKKQDNEILIFKDAIFFQYNDKYTSWDKIFPTLVENFVYLAERFKINSIERISLDYVDLFDNFPQRNFNLNYYFNIKLEFPVEFIMNFTDFIIGIKLETDELNHKSIFRVRGLLPENEDYFKIQLKTHFSIIEKIDIKNKELFVSDCETAHEFLVKNFNIILSEKTKKMIGM